VKAGTAPHERRRRATIAIMIIDETTFSRLRAYVESRGIALEWRRLPPDTPAVFDGLSIVLKEGHDRTELGCYLVHSFGSITGWCLETGRVKQLFEELRAAKDVKDTEPARFEQALATFRRFEEASAEFALGVLDSTGNGALKDDVSEFFRADLEAITLFHRTGALPVWPDFLSAWRRDVSEGRRPRRPFQARIAPPFTPIQIERQEVKQGRA
jgi:hypothetical protein